MVCGSCRRSGLRHALWEPEGAPAGCRAWLPVHGAVLGCRLSGTDGAGQSAAAVAPPELVCVLRGLPARGAPVYKTAADRPRCTAGCCPCSSGRVGRPAGALLWGRVTPGGMTTGMTATGSLDGGRTRLAPSNPRTVTLPRRTAATLARDRPGSCRCLQARARRCAKDHDHDSCDPTRPTTLVAGCGGRGAVGADHAPHPSDRLAGPPVAPGRPTRPGPAHPRRCRLP